MYASNHEHCPDDPSECSSVLHFAGIISSGKFLRDFGSHTDSISLEGSALKENLEKRLDSWQEETDQLTSLFRELAKCKRKDLLKENDKLATKVATVEKEFLKRVCQEWKEIALVCRDRVFEESEQEEIDLFDIKCKEWGHLLKELFGASLGTGDYGHLTIDHAPMLMRRFLSMKHYSQQGFEASHKDQRQLWLKASSHDCKGESTSIEQMLVHFYAEKILFLRYCFQEALRVIPGNPGQNTFNFYFRGCGWKHKTINWDEGEQVWIKVMNHLMTLMFGGDHFEYYYNEKKVCVVDQSCHADFKYDREQWNEEYASMISEGTATEVDAPMVSELMNGEENKKQDDISFKKRKLCVQEEEFNVKRIHGVHSSRQLRLTVAKLEEKDGSELGNSRLPVHMNNVNVANSGDANQDNQNRVIATFPPPPLQSRMTVLQMDLDTVEDEQELNDAIIDFFILYTSYNVSNRDVIDKCHFFSSFFYTKLAEREKRGKCFVLPSAEERHAKACSFTRRVDIFKKEFLFIPVCRSRHWFLLLIWNLPLLEAKKTNHHPQSYIFVMDSIALV